MSLEKPVSVLRPRGSQAGWWAFYCSSRLAGNRCGREPCFALLLPEWDFLQLIVPIGVAAGHPLTSWLPGGGRRRAGSAVAELLLAAFLLFAFQPCPEATDCLQGPSPILLEHGKWPAWSLGPHVRSEGQTGARVSGQPQFVLLSCCSFPSARPGEGVSSGGVLCRGATRTPSLSQASGPRVLVFGKVKQPLGSQPGWWVQQSICLPRLENFSLWPRLVVMLCGLQGGWNRPEASHQSGQRGQTPGPAWEACAAVPAPCCVRNAGCDAEPTPGAAMSSPVTPVVVTLTRSLPGVLAFSKAQEQNNAEGFSCWPNAVPLPAPGLRGPWLSLGRRRVVGAAAAPRRAGGAAGAARFASLVGLRLNKLYLF